MRISDCRCPARVPYWQSDVKIPRRRSARKPRHHAKAIEMRMKPNAEARWAVARERAPDGPRGRERLFIMGQMRGLAQPCRGKRFGVSRGRRMKRRRPPRSASVRPRGEHLSRVAASRHGDGELDEATSMRIT